MENNIVSLAITYGPTVLFIFIVLLYTFLGYIRGIRKSLIFLCYSIISCIILISLFIFLSNKDIFNYQSVKIVNNFMGEYYLQDSLGVNHSRDNLVDILIEYFLTNSEQPIINIVLYSSAYVTALAQAVLRLVLSIVLIVIHFIFKFIYYIFYLIFHKHSRYLKKNKKRFMQGRVPHLYSERRGIASLLGLVRGLICGFGLIILIGAPAYLVSYNSSYIDQIGTNSEDIEYDSIRELAKLGNSGIYKILNTVKDQNEVPYYLYVTNIIMQGKIEDEEIDYSKNVYFYTELVKYRAFIDDSINLILSYDNENKIIHALNDADFETVYNEALVVFDKEDFQKDFSNIIKAFDKDTYLIDVTYSVLNGLINNIDYFEFDSVEVEEILKIAFKKGYKCQSIRYEASLDDSVELPYVSLRELLPTSDLNSVIDLIFSIIKASNNTEDNENISIDIVKEICESIEQLSVFRKQNSNIDGVFRRIFAYISNTFLNGSQTYVETTIYDKKYDDVSWTNETMNLINVIPSIYNLYLNKFSNIDDNADFIELIFSLNDSDVSSDYNNIRNCLLDSNIISVILNSGVVKEELENSLNATFENFVYPSDLDVKESLLIIDHLISTPSNKDAFEYITSYELNSTNYETYVSKFNSLFDDYLKENFSKSNLFRSILTSSLETYASEYIYIDESVFDVDSNNNKINRITESETYNFLSSFSSLFELGKPFILENDDYQAINELIKNGELVTLLQNSKIVEGSVSKILFENDSFDFVKPSDIDYVTLGTDSEIVKLVKTCQTLKLDMSLLTNGAFDTIYDSIKGLGNLEVETIFNSDVIYYNVADYINSNQEALLNGIIIPVSCYKDNYIKKEIIESLIVDVLNLVDNDTSYDVLLDKFRDNKNILKDSKSKDILNATIAYKIVNETSSDIQIPTYMATCATRDALSNFSSNNPWYNEPYNILNALDELSGTYGSRDLDSIVSLITKNYSKLKQTSSLDKNRLVIDSLYDSILIKYNISNELCNQLKEFNVSEDVINSNFMTTYYSSFQENIIESDEIVKLLECTEVLDLDLNSGEFSSDLSIDSLNETYNGRYKYTYVNDSNIARALLSVNVKNELDSNNLMTPNKALEYYNNQYIDVYTKEEITGICYIASKCDDLSTISEKKVVDIIDLLYDSSSNVRSYIVLNKISDEIKNTNDIVIPLSCYDSTNGNSMITSTALYILLQSLLELKITTISNDMFNNAILEASNLNYTYQSDIFRATVSKVVVINYKNVQYDLEVYKQDVIQSRDYNLRTIYYMASTELKNFITELNKLGIKNTSSTLTDEAILKYINNNQNNITDSEVIHICLSQAIDSSDYLKYSVIALGAKTKETTCINLYTCDITNEQLYIFD